ncbi:MAG: DUF4112 domain-containing protein [Haloferacaceae archaeon]
MTDGDAPAGETDAHDVETVPGVVAVDRSEGETLDSLRDLSRAFDAAFTVPGTDFRVGLDPILGLLPVVGDAPGAVVSGYVVAEAARLGAPRATLGRMFLVLVVDAVVGSVPVVGDVFDAWWKANLRNVALLESALADPDRATRDRQYLLAVAAVVAGAVLAVGAGVALAAAWLLGRFGLL